MLLFVRTTEHRGLCPRMSVLRRYGSSAILVPRYLSTLFQYAMSSTACGRELGQPYGGKMLRSPLSKFYFGHHPLAPCPTPRAPARYLSVPRPRITCPLKRPRARVLSVPCTGSRSAFLRVWFQVTWAAEGRAADAEATGTLAVTRAAVEALLCAARVQELRGPW